MDTNSNIPQPRLVESVEISHIDVLGYGPQGMYTRKQWREQCWMHFRAGADAFKSWQKTWLEVEKTQNKLQRFGCSNANIKQNNVNNTDSRQFRCTLDFAGYRFDGGVFFDTYEFLTLTTFESAIFEGHIGFEKVIFNETASFRNVIFSKASIFNGVQFDEHADFSSATFTGNANFRNATFTRYAHFSDATFTEDANFISATFTGNADFGSAAFTGSADFGSATFTEAAYFSRATFTGYADFVSATFTGYANFRSATFTRYADFSSATFKESAYFSSATFKGDAYFKLSTFNRECHFENSFDKVIKNWTEQTKFEGLADFENATFKNVGHFERVHFVKHTPAFRGCQIDSTRLEFSDDSYFPSHENSDDAVKNISFLKRLADEHGQTDQALNFNAMELRAKRLQTEPKPASWSFKVVTWLYEIISDYGRSFTKPLKIFIYLFLITFFGALIFAGKSAPIICSERMLQYDGDIQSGSPVSCLSYYQTTDEFKLTGYRAAFEYASYRSSGILDFSDNDKQTSAINMRVFDQKVEPTWVRVYGVFKAIASTVLLFLAALGLRNKYRIK